MSTTRSLHFILNDHAVQSELPSGLTVLEFLRDTERLTGTRAACWEGDCGSCQVLLGQIVQGRLHYSAVNSCLLPLGELTGRHLVTIEGLNGVGLNPIQHTLVDQGAVQCGFCTPGLVVALTGYLLNARIVDIPAAIESLGGNLCRCTGYVAIRNAVQALCEHFQSLDDSNRLQALISRGILPAYFASIAEKLAALPPSRPDPSATANAILVAGGTDLFVRETERLQQANCRFLLRESTLRGVWTEAGHCLIGAATTVAEIRESPLLQACCPTLRDDLALFCSPPIRERATLAGNLVNASPTGDLIIYFLALEATLELSDGQQSRQVPLRDFYTGFKQLAKRPDEWVTRIRFPRPASGYRFSYEKVCKRQYLDIASVNTALSITLAGDRIANVRLAAGGVAPVPLLLEKTAAALHGQPLTPATVRTAATVTQTEIAPISDSRGSADYKRLLLRQLIYAHFLKLFPAAIPWGELP